MFERLLLLIIAAAAVALLLTLLRALQQRRLARINTLPAEVFTPGRPTVLAFSLPDCRDCRTRQAPVLHQLSTLPDVAVRTMRADEHPALVDRFGIMTVPSTLVVAADGRIRALNHGFADAVTLRRQLGLQD